MPAANQDPPSTQNEIAELKSRLAETEETLEAIREYMVDAFVVNRANGIEIVTLNKTDCQCKVEMSPVLQSRNVTLKKGRRERLVDWCYSCRG